MFILKRLIVVSFLAFVLASAALAQENRAPVESPRETVAPVPAGPLVTAAASAERVRFVSPGTVVQLRLEVYNEAGQKLFDTELHGGNVLDWHLQNGAGQRLPAGSYACVLTTKSLSGRLSQRVGLVKFDDKQATVEAAGASQLSLAQQQTIGPVEGNADFAVLSKSDAEAITAVTHDGIEGQLTATTGALTFRTGDLFSGKDVERVRITPEGNVGIGTDKPEAKLDVAGSIRAAGTLQAAGGVEFADGTVQTSGLSGRKDKDGNLMPNVSGTGTQNRLAKWTDNAGTLGNSNVTEAASGKLGIGTVNPNYEITLFGNDVGLQLISPVTGVTANDGFRFGIDSTNKAFLWNVEATDMYFGTTATERMRITAGGLVGIGTNNPTQKLDVAGNINTSTQYHIGGARMLSAPGTKNLFVGPGAGNANTGTNNSFFGHNAGVVNSSGSFNTFAGAFAGNLNTTGASNSFFGYNAGGPNSSGDNNSFFGFQAGLGNTGSQNSSFGADAGAGGGTTNNSFFGYRAGQMNQQGGNSFFGADAGRLNEFGCCNAFFGSGAGQSQTHGDGNSFFGNSAGRDNTGDANSFFGASAGSHNLSGDSNSFFGSAAGSGNTTGSNNTLIGKDADVSLNNLTFATAIGAGAVVSDNDSVVLGRPDGSDAVRIPGPVLIDGSLVVGTLGSAGGDQLCRNSANRIASCSSSFRYKTEVQSFRGGLDIIRRLRPISFTWKEGSRRDLGLGAEEVARVEPLLTFRNEQGEIEGVRYNQLSAVLVNAIKEQQAQITAQQRTIAQQQAALQELKRVVCRRNRRAAVCK